jgi:hypothetical protein
VCRRYDPSHSALAAHQSLRSLSAFAPHRGRHASGVSGRAGRFGRGGTSLGAAVPLPHPPQHEQLGRHRPAIGLCRETEGHDDQRSAAPDLLQAASEFEGNGTRPGLWIALGKELEHWVRLESVEPQSPIPRWPAAAFYLCFPARIPEPGSTQPTRWPAAGGSLFTSGCGPHPRGDCPPPPAQAVLPACAKHYRRLSARRTKRNA